MKKTNRRSFLRKGAAVAAAAVSGTAALKAQGAGKAAPAPASPPTQTAGSEKWEKKAGVPTGLFNSTVSYGPLLFLAGVGFQEDGDITAHTKGVIASLKTQLEGAGSSMNKVLKCNVYLKDIKDFDAMNAVYRGAFGERPPVRTTIAAAGLPGKALVEIDVIAYI